ncbi:hypothetical protein M885DRAFT_557048 [Pelagophyceae sp. CCMP2097]|nr:hypothetical protein M885DRAFT_557048 [Pelagophyceae sp. CCMP2097]
MDEPSNADDATVQRRALSDAERDSEALDASTLDWCCEALEADGVAMLENVVSSPECEALHAQWAVAWRELEAAVEPFAAMYDGRYSGAAPRFAELVPRGKRRYGMSTFSTRLRDSSVLSQLMRRALGCDAECFLENTIVALPGADEQRVHVDAGHLYDPRTHGVLPAHHFSCFVALVEQSSKTGTTAFALKSHKTHAGGHESATLGYAMPNKFVDAILPRGACIIFDSRLYHRGRANVSDAARPIYGLMWARPWFKATSYYYDRSLHDRASGSAMFKGWRERLADAGDDAQGDLASCGAFVDAHAGQLSALGVPSGLFASIWRKLRPPVGSDPVYDAGASMQIGVDDAGNTGVYATAPLHEFGRVFVLQHAWSFVGGEAAAAAALEADATVGPFVAGVIWPHLDSSEASLRALAGLRSCVQTYHVAASAGSEPTPVHFLPDVICANLREASEEGDPNACLSAAFVDVQTGQACSFLWLCTNVNEGDEVLLPHGTLEPMLRAYAETRR